jgi:hypothetical protein
MIHTDSNRSVQQKRATVVSIFTGIFAPMRGKSIAARVMSSFGKQRYPGRMLIDPGPAHPKNYRLQRLSRRRPTKFRGQTRQPVIPTFGPPIFNGHILTSIYPASFRPWRAAAVRFAGSLPTNSIAGIDACCASAHPAAVPLTSVMNSRRFIANPAPKLSTRAQPIFGIGSRGRRSEMGQNAK